MVILVGPIAKWQSLGGKYVIELRKDCFGYSYRGTGCGGVLPSTNDADAIQLLERRVMRGEFQADSNKTPMRRVF